MNALQTQHASFGGIEAQVILVADMPEIAQNIARLIQKKIKSRVASEGGEIRVNGRYVWMPSRTYRKLFGREDRNGIQAFAEGCHAGLDCTMAPSPPSPRAKGDEQ